MSDGPLMFSPRVGLDAGVTIGLPGSRTGCPGPPESATSVSGSRFRIARFIRSTPSCTSVHAPELDSSSSVPQDCTLDPFPFHPKRQLRLRLPLDGELSVALLQQPRVENEAKGVAPVN